MRAYIDGASGWSPTEHNVAAQALNEWCADLGLGHPVAYTTELLTG